MITVPTNCFFQFDNND